MQKKCPHCESPLRTKVVCACCGGDAPADMTLAAIIMAVIFTIGFILGIPL